MGAFLWAGRGSWDVGREDYKKKKKGVRGKGKGLKVVCSLCGKFIPKNSYYKHRSEVHGIKDLTLAMLRESVMEKKKKTEKN